MLTPAELKAAQKYESPEYAALCADLGFIASARFVQVTRTGSISFTLGKPDEIRALYEAVSIKGYKHSKGLIDARKRARY